MKIVMYTYGTRGDVQPCCVLGYELQKRGHQVRVIAEEKLKYVVDMFGLEYYNIPGDSITSLLDKSNVEWLKSGRLDDLVAERTKLDHQTPGRLDAFYNGSKGMDLIVTSALCTSEAQCINEKLSIPFIPMFLQPFLPTSAFPHLFVSHRNLYFSFLNKLTYSLAESILAKVETERISPLRQLLWLPKIEKKDVVKCVHDVNQDMIVAFDETMMMGGKTPSDYPERYHVTGFIYPTFGKTNLDQRVQKFIDESPLPPILFGLSSMAAPNAEQVYDMLREVVVKKLQRRLIYVKSWTAIDEASKVDNDILFVQNVDPETVYSQCSIIIHHGGVGSMAAALRSGQPSLTTWLYYDQPYWGARVLDSGAGRSIPYLDMTPTLLFNELNELLTNPSYKLKAQELSQTISKRDTINQCISIVEKVYKSDQLLKQQLEQQQ